MRPCVSRSHFPTVSAGHFLVRQVQDARQCEIVVVQCPTCQSKFRIADDKVTDRGVRVRCTSCKNVFQVRKPGVAGSDPAPGPGNTMELSALDAAALARPRAGGGSARTAAAPKPAPAAPRAAPPATRSATTTRPAPAARTPNGAARRLDADDLFGMAELTGDAPLGEIAEARSRPPTAPVAPKPTTQPIPNFDDIDLEVSDSPKPRPKPAQRAVPPKGASRPPTRPVPKEAAASPEAPPPEEAAPSEAAQEQSAEGDEEPMKIGAFKNSLEDPFEGVNLESGSAGTTALGTPAAQKKEAPRDTEAKPAVPEAPPEVVPPPGREMVSSALTGLLGAALAIAVVVAAALNDETAAGWLGLGPGTEIVATRVVSGLYDTAGGKPVFYVRGRIENRSQKVRGPVRVVAELVAEGAPEAKAEAIAGSEPTPEDVWSLRTPAEADKLTRTLQGALVERRIQPGSSLPFFAVIPDPPADLGRHKLHVRVEPVDAWVPPTPKKDGRR